jgi:cyclin-C
MAANYWASTQRLNWLFSKEKLAELRQRLEEQDKTIISQYPLPDRRLINIYINQRMSEEDAEAAFSNIIIEITKLGKRLQTRQQALATAQVYVKRFYTKVEMRRANPYLVLTTAFYLACKMEECPQHIRVVVVEARNMWPGKLKQICLGFLRTNSPDFMTSDVAKLGECEFSLISEMNSNLIVHHPYRTLSELQTTLSLSADEVALAWSIINDHYLTDLPILNPPHVIAVTAIFLAVTLKPSQTNLQNVSLSAAAIAGAVQAATMSRDPSSNATKTENAALPPPAAKVQKLVSWLAEGEISIEAVVECTQEIISLYEVWEQYNEKNCKEQIGRFVKGRGLDK